MLILISGCMHTIGASHSSSTLEHVSQLQSTEWHCLNIQEKSLPNLSRYSSNFRECSVLSHMLLHKKNCSRHCLTVVFESSTEGTERAAHTSSTQLMYFTLFTCWFMSISLNRGCSHSLAQEFWVVRIMWLEQMTASYIYTCTSNKKL